MIEENSITTIENINEEITEKDSEIEEIKWKYKKKPRLKKQK